jgi:hypothetical protein
MTLWRVLFLAEHYGRQTLTLDEVAEHHPQQARAR